jgi:imidazolonepropionase-like amidohydrolase
LRAAAHARALLDAGITTVRCVHEQNRADIHVRHARAAGWTEAPRILAAGRALTRPGGHGDGLGCVAAIGPAAFAAAAASELDAGADHIKIYASGGLARPAESLDKLQLTDEEVAAVVRTACERGAYVVAHAATSASIQQGLRAGVRSFEHGYQLDADTASRMADLGVFYTPTLIATLGLDWMQEHGFDVEAIERSRRAADAHMESARRAIEAGVTLVAGTDFPASDYSDGTTLYVRELELLAEAGLQPRDVLRAATYSAAVLVGRQSEIGAVRVGFRADLVGVDEDPTKSPSALRSLRFVMQDGLVILTAPTTCSDGQTRASGRGASGCSGSIWPRLT